MNKLSAAPFAIDGIALTFFITSAKAKAEKTVNFSLCFGVIA
ncbi:hypothetical protein [Pedobacter segetis]|nr:hypothetical protein [Pedobacter segetis]